MIANDITMRVGGEAGMGIESTGAGFGKALARGGLHVFGLPDYYSRIRGGHNFFSIRAAAEPLYSQAEPVHVLLALDLETIRRHVDDVVEGGAVIYDESEELPLELRRRELTFCPVALTALAKDLGGREVMRNTVAIGVAAGLLDFDPGAMESIIQDNFARKGQAVVDANLRVSEAGVRAARDFQPDFAFRLQAVPSAPPRLYLNGNEAFALGALAGGCRFVSGYPMTPGSPVMQWFAAHGKRYGAVVKHAEDEIAAINMALGASFVGARTMVPTSGGGFSLMVEGLGLAGMSENPVVVYEAQRPGPATGLPTRTEQGDLLFVLRASQGEFPRFLLAPGTQEEAFISGWQSLNFAEGYQTPVLVLSDHYLAASYRTVAQVALDFDAVEIDRGQLLTVQELDELEQPYARYRVTESGISPRAVPGHPNAVWVSTGDEHDEFGAISEDAGNRTTQTKKRLRKTARAGTEVPGPTRYGPENASLTFVCWGSTYGPLREAVERLNDVQPDRVAMLHFSALHPFPAAAQPMLARAKRIIVVEGNATGQFETLLTTQTGCSVDGSIRKFDGRPFSPEYIVVNTPEEV
jgi:2-oxoglutarate ferredoxin oxidoreductase subunit alpha